MSDVSNAATYFTIGNVSALVAVMTLEMFQIIAYPVCNTMLTMKGTGHIERSSGQGGSGRGNRVPQKEQRCQRTEYR